MASWQKRLRFVILVAGVVFAIVVAMAVKRRDTVESVPVVTRTDPTAIVESTGTIIIEAKGEAPEFRVDGGRYLTYADGRVRVLEGVKVRTSYRSGRSFLLSGRAAEVSADRATILINGDVRLESSDSFTATANDALYSKGEGLVRTDGPAAFAQQNISGNGVGMTYDEQREVVWILNNAVVDVAEDGNGQEPVKVHSGAAGMARVEHYLKFTGGVVAESASRSISADESTVALTEDNKRIEMIELRGNSRVDSRQGGAGALRSLNARDINLTYAEDGRTLQRAALAGTSVIEIAGEAAGQERRLTGEYMEIGLAPNGRTVTDMVSREHVEFTMPGIRNSASRTVRAGSFEAGGNGDGGLDYARFREGIEYHETPAGSSQPRVIKARDLDVRFQAGLLALEDARFMNDVSLEDGHTRGTGSEARYMMATGKIILVGRPGALPHIETAEGSVDAERFEIEVDNRRITSRTKVKSTILPIAEARAAGGGATKRPQIMKADQAINGMADLVTSDEKNGRATYTGSARVWQVDTSIQADTITMDDRTGDMTARGNVRSTMMLVQTNPDLPQKRKPGDATKNEDGKPAGDPPAGPPENKDPKPTKITTIAAARELQYDDKLRRVTYRNNAHVVGAQGDLRADRVELYLSEDGERLERAEAYGHVELRDEGREARSRRLTYYVADERYVLDGDVRVIEPCRETTGQTLTLFKSTDTIFVDGKLLVRTQTRSGNNPQTKSGATNTPQAGGVANTRCSGAATPR
ncbi:MAG: LPS export ABC transporter periplasmic protein LptC [Acidobacteria bacterium]|nr:LPS export ABC transporter periplasmic protein LptC [Acidobacteriota bacterium]